MYSERCVVMSEMDIYGNGLLHHRGWVFDREEMGKHK